MSFVVVELGDGLVVATQRDQAHRKRRVGGGRRTAHFLDAHADQSPCCRFKAARLRGRGAPFVPLSAADGTRGARVRARATLRKAWTHPGINGVLDSLETKTWCRCVLAHVQLVGLRQSLASYTLTRCA